MFNAPTSPLLALRRVVKTFPGQVALGGVDIDVMAGEVHALVGQNGCGKSTLIKVLAGVHQPDTYDQATMDSAPFQLGSPAEANRLGMRFVHQSLGLIDKMNAVENCALSQGFPTGRLWHIRWQSERQRVRALLHRFGVDIDPNEPVGRLRPAQKTMVAIVRALQDWEESARLLILDEPTATLPAADVEHLFEVVQRVVDHGLGVLFVSHRLDEVFEIAARVTVFRDGLNVLTASTGDLDHAGLVQAMIGRSLDSWVSTPPAPTREPAMVVTELAGREVRDLSFTLWRGEILGVAGLLGSGRDGLAELVYGAAPRDRGTIMLDGRRLAENSPRAAIRSGLAMVPADRTRHGALSTFTVRENLTLGKLKPFFRRGRLSRRRERLEAQGWIRNLDVRPARTDIEFFKLSGGNQQKVVLARCLRMSPTVLLLDEPTQGVDIGAKAAIYKILTERATEHLAVMLCSGDSEELARVCDRVLVLAYGRLTAEITGESLTPDHIDHAMLQARGAAIA